LINLGNATNSAAVLCPYIPDDDICVYRDLRMKELKTAS
jgi:hypothetical protein